MTDENTHANQTTWPLEAFLKKPGFDRPEIWRPLSGHYKQYSVEPGHVTNPELPINSKLDDELRKFEFKRRFEKIQFQVREEFKSEAAKIALELWRSKPLADALNQPGPCDGDLHSKIMPFKGV